MALQNYIASVTFHSFYFSIWKQKQKNPQTEREHRVFSAVSLCCKINMIQGTKLLVCLQEQECKSELKGQQNKGHTCLLCGNEKGREKEQHCPKATCHCYPLQLMVTLPAFPQLFGEIAKQGMLKFKVQMLKRKQNLWGQSLAAKSTCENLKKKKKVFGDATSPNAMAEGKEGLETYKFGVFLSPQSLPFPNTKWGEMNNTSISSCHYKVLSQSGCWLQGSVSQCSVAAAHTVPTELFPRQGIESHLSLELSCASQIPNPISFWRCSEWNKPATSPMGNIS